MRTRLTVATMNSVFHFYDFALWLLDELKINCEKIEIVEQEDIDGPNGLCMDNSLTDYTLFIRTVGRVTVDSFVTLAHEMVHVYQFLHKDLNDVDWNIPYETRWWELEAVSMSPGLVKKYSESKIKRYFDIKECVNV